MHATIVQGQIQLFFSCANLLLILQLLVATTRPAREMVTVLMERVSVTNSTVENSASKRVRYSKKKLSRLYFTLFCLTGECEDDGDCSGSSRGSCIDLEAVSFPSKMCFCAPGWHGDNCATGAYTIDQAGLRKFS